MFKRRKMRFNGEWSLLAGNRVYELTLDLIRLDKGYEWQYKLANSAKQI